MAKAGVVIIEFDETLAAELGRELPGINSVRGRVHHVCHEWLRARQFEAEAVTSAGGGERRNDTAEGAALNDSAADQAA